MGCDLLLMLGTDFPYTEFLPQQTKTVQVDSRLPNIGNRASVSLGIHGDVKPTLQKLLTLVEERPSSAFHDKICENFTKWRESTANSASPSHDHEPLHPQIFAAMIDKYASDDAIVVVDTGTATVWASRHISFHSKRRMIGSFNHGSMAVGLPAALGAQLLYPDREVWALVGDGAFTMAMQDWITIANQNLPIKMVVLHNNSLAFVKLEMEVAGIVPESDVLSVDVPDLSAYSKWCGADGVRVEHADRIESAIRQAKESEHPFLVDAVVSSGELMMPPTIGIEQATGMASSKFKQALMALSGDHEQWNKIKEEIAAYFD
jgi:thiamine pyrophosphate-dependent acetolactate synthase large subunit-like protein